MRNQILQGDCLSVLKTLPSNLVNMVMTSPPYFQLRSYDTSPNIYGGNKDCQHEWQDQTKKVGECKKCKGQGFEAITNTCIKCGAWRGSLGQEPTIELYVKNLCDIFDECRRVLKNDGSLWLNLGDSYKDKCLLQVPARVSLEMCNRGWILRSEIIWSKPNVLPSSVKDRFTPDFEKLFFFVKQPKYYFKQQLEPLAASSIERAKYGDKSVKLDSGKMAMTSQSFNKAVAKMIEKGGRNKRCVWRIPTKSFRGAHFATMPMALCETPIAAGCPKNGIVLDPFMGAGTTAMEAIRQGKDYLGIELNADYIKIAEKRIEDYKKSLPVEMAAV